MCLSNLPKHLNSLEGFNSCTPELLKVELRTKCLDLRTEPRLQQQSKKTIRSPSRWLVTEHSGRKPLIQLETTELDEHRSTGELPGTVCKNRKQWHLITMLMHKYNSSKKRMGQGSVHYIEENVFSPEIIHNK